MKKRGKYLLVITILIGFVVTISYGEPISYFEISPGGTNLIKLTDEDQVVNVQYATGTEPTLTATLNNDAIPSTDITLTETTKTGTITIKPSHPVFTNYGIYDLTVEIENTEGMEHLNLYIFYEAKVAGLPPPGQSHFCNINETYLIEFDLVSGSNILSEWMFDQYSILQIYSGDINRLWKNYSCDAILQDNVTIVAANNASAEYTWFLLTVQYPVNNVVAAVDLPVIETSKNLKFDIQTLPGALTPMGTLFAQIFYHTGDNETKPFTPGVSTEFIKSFTTQGQFKANVSIWSESSSDDLEIDFAVWDKLEDLTLEPTNQYAEVGKVVKFQFINPPPSGFEYIITYGNSKQAFNTKDDLYLPFSQAPLNTTYTEPITYNISMRSFNPEYEKNHTTSIVIQHAVGNLTITPSSLVIPYDNATAEFTLSMDHEMPPPTSVSCHFEFGDGNSQTVALNLTWTSPFSHIYTYSNIGNYSAVVVCSNQISNITLYSTIGVRHYTIDDVNLFHQNPFPTNFSEGRDVEFSIKIKDLDVTPPNTQLTWDFGDGSSLLVQTLNEWIFVHHFPKRDIFIGSLKIDMGSATRTIAITQQIGTVTISSDILIVLAGNPVFFTTQIISTGSLEPFSCQIDFGDGTDPALSQNSSHSFADGGYYIATAKVFNSTFSEFNTVEDVLVVENPLTNLIPMLPPKVEFPPGNIILSLGLPQGSKQITFVTCEYNFGDTVDNVLHYHTDNISQSNPITFQYTYTKLGQYTISYNCSNVLTWTHGTINTFVQNECFSTKGIFDPQYSYVANPMRIYTSQLMQISSRLTIHCGKDQPRFVWTMLNITDGNKTQVSLVQPGTDFIRFPKNSIPKGKYCLSLNVSFALKPDSWLSEITFLEFRDPPIRAEIVGGFQRTTGMRDITIDAVPLSYDPLKEQGEPDDLEYSWTCRRVNTTTVLELLSKYKNESYSIPCNSVSYQLSAGTLLFKASSEDRPIGYIYTVEVNKPGRTAGIFIQTVQVLYDAPDINILCIINCEIKVALSTELSLQTQCTSCFAHEYHLAVYEWRMSRLLNQRTDVVNIDLASKIRDTGSNPTSIVINANVFEPGGEYIVEVTVDIPGRLSKGYASYVVNANLPPYNGSCYSVPTEGIVSKTKFQIICENYMDEGFRSVRDDVLDVVEPLSYKYVIKKGDQTIPLDDGVESTSAELEVPIFPGADGTDYQLVTYIYDILQDYAVSYMDITLTTPLNSTSHTDASTQVSNIMAENEDMLKDVNISGSTVRFTRVVNSVISVVQSIELPDNTILFDEASDIVYDENSTAPDWRTVYNDYLTPKDTEAEDKVKKVGESQMEALLNRKDDVLDLNGGGVKQLTATVSNILRNPKATSLNTATMGSKLALASANGLEGIIKHRPYKFRAEIGTAVEGMAEMMGGILKTTVPDLKGRVPTLDKDAILQEVEATGKGGPGISREEAAHLAYKIAESEQLAVEKQKQTTRSMIVDVEDSLDKSQNALSSLLVRGQEAKTIVKEELTLSARKLSPDDLANVDIKTGDDITVNLPGTNGTGVMVNETLDVQTTVFKTNPYTWGKNDSSYDIQSKVVRMKVKSENGTTVKIPVTLKLKTENPPDFKGFGIDETVKGDEGMHYHTFPLRKTFDVCMVYVAAPVHVINVTAYFRINKTPKVNKYDYKTHGENYTLRGNDVFKITVPVDTFPDVGTVIAGLVFVEGARSLELPNSRRRRSVTNNSTMPNTTEAPSASDNVTGSSMDTDIGIAANVDIEAINETLATFDKYSVLATTDGCRVWDETTEAWDPRACKISPYSTPDETICVCDDPPGTSFASSFYVPPNTIDFDVIWSKFDVSNASVYGTLIVIIVLYIFIALWTNRKDEKDKERWCVGYLTDNLSDDRHFYLLTVYTGLRKNAGTKSGIYFIMAGTQGDTGVRCLTDGKREFETSSVLNLVCSSSIELGDLTYFRVWHDNKGHGSDGNWFLSKIIVQDLQTHQRYVFLNDRWLGIDKDDGMIDRLIPVTCKDDLMTFDKLFSAHARLNVTDAHLWLSVFLRPDKSTFSRLQRSSCCLALLFLTMIVNAMFFKSENDAMDEETVRNDFQLGILRFSMSTIFTSFISVVITVPPLILLVFLFKSSKPPPDYFKLKQNTSCICCRKKKQIIPTIVVEEPEGDDILDNADLNKMLPTFCIKIAWVLVVIIVLVCSFFLILYSMDWGKSISEEWLTAFFLSFFENLFVMDPAKVLLMSVLLACLLRSPYNQADKVNVEKVQTEVQKFGLTEVDVSQLPPDPIPESLMEKARKRRKEELKAQSVFMNLIMYGVFLFALYAVCYGNRDTNNFAFQTHIENDIFTDSFEKIQSYDDFFNWVYDKMVPSLFPVGNFRGDKLNWRERLFYNDHVNFRVGPARIRQIRIKERPPPYYGAKYMNLIDGYSYYWPYFSSKSETGGYCPGWTPQPCSLDTRLRSSTLDAWLHTTSDDAWGMPVSGHLELYEGDGYFLEISVNRDVSMDMINEVKKYGWLDRQTRAVFVEFSLYNANNNLLTFVQLIAEFPEFGSVLTWKQIQTLRVFQNVGPIGAFIVLCEIIVLIILMVFGYKCIKLLIKQKLAFFTSFWNIMDLLTFIITLFGVAFFICREVYSSLTLTKFRADPKKFVNFEHIVLWDSMFVYSLSFLVFTATIGMLRILGYNRRFTMIGEVLRASAKNLIGFGFVFGIFYFAYIASGFVLFMTKLKQFRTPLDAGVSIFTYLLGKNQLGMMLGASDGLGALYFFTLVFFVILILLTMFQAIMNNTMTVVRSNVTSIPPPYGIVNVLTNIYKSIISDWIPSGLIKKKVEEERKQAIDLDMRRKRSQVHNILETFKEQFEKSLDVKGASARDKRSFFDFEKAFETTNQYGSNPGPSPSRSRINLPSPRHNAPYHDDFY